MKKITDKWHKIKIYISIFVLLICTIIGGYGILRAPKSDQSEMKRELEHNQQELEEEETIPGAETDTKEDALKDSPAGNTQSPEETQQPGGRNPSEEIISVIGESVFLGAAPSFKKLYKRAVIDAKVSRQVSQALDVAKKLEKKNRLGNVVIISLGTNGNFNQATGQKLIDYLGKDRTIYWIDAYGKKLDIQQQVNRTIQKLAKKNSNVHLIPWSKEAKKHPSWFYQDGTHLNIRGQEGFSRFINKSINELP